MSPSPGRPSYGCQSEVGVIRRLILKRPQEAFRNQRCLASQWRALGFRGCPDFQRAIDEYDAFLDLIGKHNPEILFLPEDPRTGLDSIYVHDPILVTRKGAILCRMGKRAREAEPESFVGPLERVGVPILGAITGDGRLEGGDVVWLDDATLAVGRGYRTNDEGIRQLRRLLEGIATEICVVPLPHWEGPGGVLHLMSLLSPVDHNLAVVYSRLLPIPFREWWLDRGYRLVEVPDSEFDSLGANVLAIGPRRCIMLAGNPVTRALLEAEGVEVREFAGAEICLKGCGGPTCLTRPILRV